MKTPHQRRRPLSETEVQAARGRLRGALNDSLQGQEVDDISEDYEEEDLPPPPPPVVQRRPQRGRPRKIPATTVQPRVYSVSPPMTPNKRRRMRERELAESSTSGHNQKIQAESFVMKLFDRSLDLSKYTEQTALYPICRAWMANQPRNPSIRSYREARSPSPSERVENGGEILSQLRTGDMRDVTTLPKAKKTDVPKIPPQQEPQKYDASEELFAVDDSLADGEKEELMSQHLSKWKGIKKDWQKHTKRYQKRNEVNFLILQELFTP